MNEKEALEQKLKSILELDESIRFVGFLLSDGTLESFIRRPGMAPLLDSHESQKSYLHTILRAASYKSLDSKLGKSIWTVTLKQKIKWLTIYLDFGMIILSTEVNSDHDKIIQNSLEILKVYV
ncbi:MAG: hypothetical protein FJ356_00305 [Thaumarchaeota archaeon]|nr:hypothetical protein [Nitrososphaerota archaeon]